MTDKVGKFRVALIVPSSNTVMENDFHAALPKEQFSVHTDRMYLVETTREAEVKMIKEHAPAAAADLRTVHPDLIVFGCTSAGSLFGLDYDAEICSNLGRVAGCPSLGVISSVASALDATGARRIAVLTPYNDDLTRAVARATVSSQREVVAAYGMGITDNVALADPTPRDILKFAKATLSGTKFDGLFVSCTNFRAYEAREALQSAFGVPVVTSNSAAIQAVLARAESNLGSHN
ncbi:aspartate/glutamate racemase family protein [Roseovarius pacificus]|uniref:maleate cis-trans isomerase family protein n=1 Tax=Roseovarius pacificus TaxID=337701 RepID=UPI002A18843D|nr:aspartate/glutamate racemase family protein [Roseovarius pacificus]